MKWLPEVLLPCSVRKWQVWWLGEKIASEIRSNSDCPKLKTQRKVVFRMTVVRTTACLTFLLFTITRMIVSIGAPNLPILVNGFGNMGNFMQFLSFAITSAKNPDWNVSLRKIFVLVRIQGLLILMWVRLAVLKICAVLHLSGV